MRTVPQQPASAGYAVLSPASDLTSAASVPPAARDRFTQVTSRSPIGMGLAPTSSRPFWTHRLGP